MSAGGSTSQSQSQNQSHSDYDPQVLALQTQRVQAADDFANSHPYQPYSGTPLNVDATTANRLASYAAPTVSGTGYGASTYGAQGVTAGQLSNTDLTPYLNPFTHDVIDSTTAQLARQNQIDNTNAAAKATAAGAFGGSRSAVLQNLNTDSYQRNLGQTVAGLNQANFTQAQQGALADIANRLAADQFTAAARNAAGQFNAGAQNAAGQFGAAANNAAALANQQANLAAAGVQAQGQTLLDQQAQAAYDANWNQYLNGQTYPLSVQQMLNQTYGLLPTSPLSDSSGSSSGDSDSFNFGVPLKPIGPS